MNLILNFYCVLTLVLQTLFSFYFNYFLDLTEFYYLTVTESKIKVSAGLVPPKGCEGRACAMPLSLACKIVVFSGDFSPPLPLGICVSLSKFLFYESCWIRIHPSNLILALLPL